MSNTLNILCFSWQNIVPDTEFCIILPGDGIPEWIRHQMTGSSVTIELPPDWYDGNFLGFAVCLVFEGKMRCFPGEISCQLNNFAFYYTYWSVYPEYEFLGPDHVWLAYQPRAVIDICHPEEWSHITVSFEVTRHAAPHVVRKCGIRLMYAHDYEKK